MRWRSNLLGRTSALRSLSGDLWDPELPRKAAGCEMDSNAL